MTASRFVTFPAVVAALRVHDEPGVTRHIAGTPQHDVGCQLHAYMYCARDSMLGEDQALLDMFSGLVSEDALRNFMHQSCDNSKIDCSTFAGGGTLLDFNLSVYKKHFDFL